MSVVVGVLQDLFVNSEWQQIDRIPDSRLYEVAAARAWDMATRNYFSHEDQDGHWPNWWVRHYQYLLPESYDDECNQVESLARGFLDPREALAALVASPSHHEHMTGQGFWHDHIMFGVGYAVRGLNTYYVIITAPQERKAVPDMETVYLPRVEKWIVNP